MHLGNGRFFSPALGRPLQPHSAAAPPTIPQALNRYAATAVGQPGVYAAGGNWYDAYEIFGCCQTLDIPVDLGALVTGKFAEKMGLVVHLQTRTATIDPTGNTHRGFVHAINRDGGVRVWEEGQNRRVWLESHYGRTPQLSRYLDQGVIELSAPNRWNRAMSHEFSSAFGGKFTLADELVGGGAGFLFDAGWQVAQDWNDPFLTPTVRVLRGSISGGIGLGAGLLVAATIGTGPAGFIVAVGIGWALEAPLSNWIFQKTGLIPTRNLLPLHYP